jgi:hypothetical protein
MVADEVVVVVTLLPVYIVFPWLRDVPEGISSGTWGQNDPAESLLASDSVRRRKKRNTRTEEAVREGRLMECTSMWRPGGWDGQTTEPQLV